MPGHRSTSCCAGNAEIRHPTTSDDQHLGGQPGGVAWRWCPAGVRRGGVATARAAVRSRTGPAVGDDPRRDPRRHFHLVDRPTDPPTDPAGALGPATACHCGGRHSFMFGKAIAVVGRVSRVAVRRVVPAGAASVLSGAWSPPVPSARLHRPWPSSARKARCATAASTNGSRSRRGGPGCLHRLRRGP